MTSYGLRIMARGIENSWHSGFCIIRLRDNPNGARKLKHTMEALFLKRIPTNT